MRTDQLFSFFWFGGGGGGGWPNKPTLFLLPQDTVSPKEEDSSLTF